MGAAARHNKRARRGPPGDEASSDRAAHPPHIRAATAMAAQPRNAGNPRVSSTDGDIVLALVVPYLRFSDLLALRLVCRQWRSSCRLSGIAPPPFPWLMLPPLSSRGVPAAAETPRRFYDIPGGRAFTYEVPAYQRCVATRGGWLVLAAVDRPRRIVLANPITGARDILPWPFGDNGPEGIRAVLTSSPADPACFLAVAADRMIAYCRPGRAPRGGGGANAVGVWATLRAPGFRHDTVASDIAAVGSTVYLVDERRKLWRADLAVAEPKMERRDTAFALPGNPERLDWQARMWMPKAASVLGDRVLLLGHGCSVAVPAYAAPGRAPGTVLFARQTWDIPHLGSSSDRDGAQQWFWSEFRLGAGAGDQIVMRKTVPHWPGFFCAGDSFWFFPGIDRGERA
ncbi:hypothetical protein QOZ80_2BG0169710 [Eleusine coracana subsp. coracana]|nr:hypothetical protein QOZ80_2BG0169710 [Eleusine coracana subsp. coracana]